MKYLQSAYTEAMQETRYQRKESVDSIAWILYEQVGPITYKVYLFNLAI